MKNYLLIGLFLLQIIWLVSMNLAQDRSEQKQSSALQVHEYSTPAPENSDPELQHLKNFEDAWVAGTVDPLSTKPSDKPKGRPGKWRHNAVKANTNLADRSTKAVYVDLEWKLQRASALKAYSKFFIDNQVSSDKISNVLDLLADANASVGASGIVKKNTAQVEFAAVQDVRQGIVKELGEELTVKLENYTATIPARREIQEYSNMLISEGMNIGDEKIESLVEIITLAEANNPAGPLANAKILTDATAVLSDKQLAVLDDMLRRKAVPARGAK